MQAGSAVLSTALVVVGALIIVALERRFPADPRQRLLRDGFWTDLVLYSIVQSYLLGFVIAALIGWLDGATGLSRRSLMAGWPLALQFPFFLVTHDLYIYCFHRLQHRLPWLWRIHEAHHSGTSVDWLSGSRSHALEILINQTVEFAPLVLLGAHPAVAAIKVTVDAVWGMYIHSNIGVRSGRLQYFINGPEMHRWHHAADLAREVNFATKLAIWDWLFGTAHLPPERPTRFGLWGNAPFPTNFLAQQLFAFRRFERPRATEVGAPPAAGEAAVRP
jgi:sterol desaturase/sphingolipid hydroxylase (fatty acid hydroxylase superfamily)